MIALGVVLLLGVGIGALGLVESDLYIVGALLLFVGGVGVLVRLADLIRLWRPPG